MPLLRRIILIRRSDSMAQRTLNIASGVPGTVPACLDACQDAGYTFGGVEYGG